MEIQDREGQKGYGEGTPRSYVTGEDIQSTKEATSKICQKLLGQNFNDRDDFLGFLEGLSVNGFSEKSPSAVCAVELALLDLFCKKQDIPVWKLFEEKPITETMCYSSILPLVSKDYLESILKLTVQYGICQIKAKASSSIEETVETVSVIRKRLGDEVDMRLDANGAFNASEATRLVHQLKRKGHDISSFEQPVPKEDKNGLKRVEQETGVAVIADESFSSERDLDEIVKNRFCKGINIRISKCGGFLRSKKMVRDAMSAGLFCQLGCHVGETSILAAAGRHLAAVCPPFRFVEGCYSRFLLKEDICKNPIEFGFEGRAKVPEGPGLGIEIDEGVLERRCKRLYEFVL